MSPIERLDARGVAIARRLALLAVCGMLALAGLTVLDVLMRAIANSPIYAFREISELIFAVVIVATFPAGLAERRNISIEMLTRPLGRKATEVFTAVGSFFLMGYFIVMSWRYAVFAAETTARGDDTFLLHVPMGPFWWMVSVLMMMCVPIEAVIFLVKLRQAREPGRAAATTGGGEVETEASVFSALAAEKLAELKPGWSAMGTVGVVSMIVAVAFFLVPFVTSWPVLEMLPGGKATLALLVFVGMWVLALLLVPLGAAMGLAGIAGAAFVVGPGPALSNYANAGSYMVANLNLAVIPLFLMMGSFASAAGLASDIYRLAHAFLRHRPGGLAMATVGGCAGFGAVTGSSIATVATIGRVAFPEMKKRGYSARLSTGAIAAGGTLGTLVPPSGTMVLYAILTEVSIGKMFIAALVPAVLAVLFYFVVIYAQVKLRPGDAPWSAPADRKEKTDSVVGAWAVFLLFGIVIGGIYLGVFTATEAAAIGAGGSFFLAWARGGLKGGAFWRVMGETAATSAMIYILILGGITFGFFIGVTQLPETMTEFLKSLDVPPIVVIALLLALFVVLGAVIDPHGILIITVPIVAPLIEALGFDLVWWGILMIVVVEIGVVTPPVGINVFVMKAVAPEVPLGTVFRGITPFVTADVVRLFLLAFVPPLVLFLPQTMR